MTHDPHALDRLRIHREPAKRRPFPWALALGILIAVLLAGFAIAWPWLHKKPLSVQTSLVKASVSGGPSVLLNASGYVTARLSATVSSKVTGKVLDVLVEEGLRVEAGQVLAHLDASNTEANLRLVEAQLDSTRLASEEIAATLSLAEKDLARIRGLHTKSLVSDSEIDRSESEARALRARLARQKADIAVAERQVAIWKQQLDDTVIRAPFSGIVTSKNAQPGEMISPMSSGGFTRTGICTLVDMSSLEIEVDVNESYINRVVPGQSAVAALDAYPDWKIPCRVIATIPTADRQKASVRVRVGILTPDTRILPDMGVKVAFEGTAAEASKTSSISVSVAALRSREGRDYVFVLNSSHAEQRAVALGLRNGREVFVTAGLSAGETIILDPPAELVDGSPVSQAKP